MNRNARNQRAMKALGIGQIDFLFYRAGKSHWQVTLSDGEDFTVALPNLATEVTVIRAAAERLARRGYPVEYPKEAS